MSKIDSYLDNSIGQKIIAKDKLRNEGRKSSGKLSAGMLNDPLQWQILKILGILSKEIEEYVLRKFCRGNQIEEWVVGEIPDVIEKQKFVEYKNCIGYADALVDTKDWNFKMGIIPIEIKSVANAKFKRIIRSGCADKGHILQTCLYALGLKVNNFAVVYVASDDLRLQTYIYETKKYENEINLIIDLFHKTLEDKIIPTFFERESWQKNLLYNKFPEWVNLTEEELKIKAKELYAKRNF